MPTASMVTGRENSDVRKLCGSCRTVARHAFPQVPPTYPGYRRGCAKVADELSNTCQTNIPGAATKSMRLVPPFAP